MSSATRRVAADASAGLSPWPFTGVALVGAVLTVLGFLLYYLQGGLSAAYPPLLWRATQASSSLLGQPPAERMSGRAARQSPSSRRHCGCAAGTCRAHHAGLSG